MNGDGSNNVENGTLRRTRLVSARASPLSEIFDLGIAIVAAYHLPEESLNLIQSA